MFLFGLQGENNTKETIILRPSLTIVKTRVLVKKIVIVNVYNGRFRTLKLKISKAKMTLTLTMTTDDILTTLFF